MRSRPRWRKDWPLLLPAGTLTLLALAGGGTAALAFAGTLVSTTLVALVVWLAGGRVLVPVAARAFRGWRRRIVIVPGERAFARQRNAAWRVMRLTAVPVGLLGFVAFVTTPALDGASVAAVLGASFVPALFVSAIAPVVWAIGESRARWVHPVTGVPHALEVPWLTRLGVIAAVGYLWRLTGSGAPLSAPSALVRLLTVAAALVSAYTVFVIPVWVYARVLLDKHADALTVRLGAQPVSVSVRPVAERPET